MFASIVATTVTAAMLHTAAILPTYAYCDSCGNAFMKTYELTATFDDGMTGNVDPDCYSFFTFLSYEDREALRDSWVSR